MEGSAVTDASDDLFSASRELIELAVRHNVALGCAESCTGGLVSASLTAVPGSSAVVMGGVVSYAIEVKRRVLGVSSEILDDPALGAVSAECAEEMAAGAARVLHADVAVSVTGIAGPGGAEPGKPVGTVWLGLCCKGRTRSRLLSLSGDREAVRAQAVREAVALLREGVVEAAALA